MEIMAQDALKTEQEKLAGIDIGEALYKEIDFLSIRDYSSNDKELKSVLDEIFQMFSDKFIYIKGYQLPDSARNKKINISLKNSKLSVALTYIATEAHLQMREVNGLIVFSEFEIGSPEPVIVAIPLKRETASKLNISNATTAQEAMMTLGINAKAAHYSKEEGVLLVKTTNENIDLLRLFIKLSERGFNLKVEKQ